MRIRVANTDDAAAIIAVINSAFRKAEAFLIDRNRVDSDLVHSLLEKGKFLVADGEATLAGCVYLELRGDRAYLGLLSVHPQRQNAGLGSRLMEEAERYSAGAGCKFMDLQIVNLRRELPSFYRHRGYIETGTAPFPPEVESKVPCHFVKMSKQLG